MIRTCLLGHGFGFDGMTNSVDGIPPHVCASLNDRQVASATVLSVLFAIFAN